jgi:hypothetical protein
MRLRCPLVRRVGGPSRPTLLFSDESESDTIESDARAAASD